LNFKKKQGQKSEQIQETGADKIYLARQESDALLSEKAKGGKRSLENRNRRPNLALNLK
jgi:hypothetical protein